MGTVSLQCSGTSIYHAFVTQSYVTCWLKVGCLSCKPLLWMTDIIMRVQSSSSSFSTSCSPQLSKETCQYCVFHAVRHFSKDRGHFDITKKNFFLLITVNDLLCCCQTYLYTLNDHWSWHVCKVRHNILCCWSQFLNTPHKHTMHYDNLTKCEIGHVIRVIRFQIVVGTIYCTCFHHLLAVLGPPQSSGQILWRWHSVTSGLRSRWVSLD